MNLVAYWNPEPIVRHCVDEDAHEGFDMRTLCGVPIVRGWESGEDHLEETGLTVGCKRCAAIMEKKRQAAAKNPIQSHEESTP